MSKSYEKRERERERSISVPVARFVVIIASEAAVVQRLIPALAPLFAAPLEAVLVDALHLRLRLSGGR